MLMKILFFTVMLFSVGGTVFAADTAQESNEHWRWICAALTVSCACIAGSIAVGRVGSSAMGAMSEKPELAGKALPFIGLAEGICLWGFLVALLILFI